MTSRVYDTAAGRKISAYVILNKKGECVATVQAHYGDAVLVNVMDNKSGFQSQRASGCGYDMFTSALAGMTIDGHELTDHCGTTGAPKPPRGRKTWPRDAKCKRGYSFANFVSATDTTPSGWGSCYRLEGLKYLEAFGYKVHKAI